MSPSAHAFVIPGRAEKPKLPENFGATTWEKLTAAVSAVHSKSPVSQSFEELYRCVEDACLHKLAPEIYAKLRAVCESHVAEQLRRLRARSSPDPVVFLGLVDECWSDHCDAMLTIRSLFLYLDRTHVTQMPGTRSLWEMGLQLFRKSLLGGDGVNGGDAGTLGGQVVAKAVRGLLALVEKERMGESVDRARLKRLLRMFASLGIYQECFEKPFLEASTSFYRTEGERVMGVSDVPDYLRHCEARLAEESERCDTYLNSGTARQLTATVEANLVACHIGGILDKGFDVMMSSHNLDDLSRLHGLLARVGRRDRLRAAFGAYVKRQGTAVVRDEENDKDMVQRLLDMKDKADNVVADAFDGEEMFGNALKEAFESFINCRQNRPAELIAKFIDARLRAGTKGAGSEEETEGVLDAVLTLFRYIQGKDVFEAFYKKDLAKRLLLGKSASIDSEKSMISRLKAECGSQFTNKLEGMFKDVDLSRDIMRGFEKDAARTERIPDGVEMQVNIITAGCWPTYAPTEVNLPRELSVYQDAFRDYYLNKHSGRRLVWQNSLGHCVLKAVFPQCGAKELAVSLFQAVVCMLFNDAETMTFEEIRAATGIDDRELRRTLQSLACGKVRVLVKDPKGRDVLDGDAFRVNEGFNERLHRIKVNSIQMKESVEENKQTNERVFQDRQYQIDAAIVRVMKTRKTLSHQLLISEIFNQIKFPAKPTDLKKRIESLIDREYLERDRNNAQIYNYLA